MQEQAEKLTAEITETEEQSGNLERFISKVHKYLDLQELTPEILNDMVKRVYVHAPQTIDGKRTRRLKSAMIWWGFCRKHCSGKMRERHKNYAVPQKSKAAVLPRTGFGALFFVV